MNRPVINNINDIIFHRDKIKKCKQWLDDFRDKKPNTKKILLIIGNSGVGKTYIAEQLYKLYNYKIYEFNSSDIRSKKRVDEIFRKSLSYHSVLDMFNNRECSIGVLIDELETLCSNGEKGSMTELLNIMKDKNGINNPIIATCQDINDKKLSDFKKLSETIYLKNPVSFELEKFIENILKLNSITIDTDAKIILTKKCNGDINKLLYLLEDLYSRVYNLEEHHIDLEMVEKISNIYDDKIIDFQLNDIINKILYQKLSINHSIQLFQNDCLIIPLMVHQNIVKRINNTKSNNKKKWNILSKILESLSINDLVQSSLFELNDWDNLLDISAIYGSSLINYNCSQLDRKSNNEDNYFIDYSLLLNKTSHMYINKKLLSEVPNLFNNYYFDKENIFYIIECINKLLYGNVNDLKRLALFMKRYNITVHQIEEIIKLDKFNMNETDKKNKKRLTVAVKKNLEKFLF